MEKYLVACLGSKNGPEGTLTQVASLRVRLTLDISSQLLAEGKRIRVVTLGDHRNEDHEPCHGKLLKESLKPYLPHVPVSSWCTPNNTAQELVQLREILERNERLLIATSPSHVVRVALLAEALVPLNRFRVFGYQLPHDAPVNHAAYEREADRIRRILSRGIVIDPKSGEKLPIRDTPTPLTAQLTYQRGAQLIG